MSLQEPMKSASTAVLILLALSGCAEPAEDDPGVTIALEDPLPFDPAIAQAATRFIVVEVVPESERSPGFDF